MDAAEWALHVAEKPKVKLEDLWRRGVDSRLRGEDGEPLLGAWERPACPDFEPVEIHAPSSRFPFETIYEIRELDDFLPLLAELCTVVTENPHIDCYNAVAETFDLLETLHTKMFARVVPFLKADIPQHLYIAECFCDNVCWFCVDPVADSDITQRLAGEAGPCTLEDFVVNGEKGTLTLELESVPVGHPPVTGGPLTFTSEATGKVSFVLCPEPRLKNLFGDSTAQEIAQDWGRLHWNLGGVVM
jgi:hypothetical protein